MFEIHVTTYPHYKNSCISDIKANCLHCILAMNHADQGKAYLGDQRQIPGMLEMEKKLASPGTTC